MANRLAQFLVQRHFAVLLCAIGIALVCFPLALQLRMDWRVERMFAEGDPLVQSYHDLQDRFGGNDMCLAVYRDPGLWNDDGHGLERLATVSNRLSEIEGVQAVLSLAELHEILQQLRGPMQLFSLGPKKPPLLDPDDKLAQAFANVFEGYTHKRESQVVAIACLLRPLENEAAEQLGPSRHEATIQRIRDALLELPAPAEDAFVTGEPVLVAEGFKMVQRDGWRLGIVSSVLVSCVLLVCFRSVRWTLIPIVVVHWSLLMTQAALVICQLELTMISSTLTAIVTVIGVATTMHLLLQYQQFRRQALSREAAMQQAFATLLIPIFWACITDAVGFLALTLAQVGPVRDFGIMMAVGSLSVFGAIVLLVPGLALFGSWDTDPSTPRLDLLVRLKLKHLLKACLERRRAGLFGLAGLLLFAALGSTRMEVETDFTKNFHADSPMIHGFSVIERELGGAGVWDIMLPAPATLSADYFSQVQDLEEELRKIETTDEDGSPSRLTKVLSMADALEATQESTMLSALPTRAKVAGMRAAMPEFTGALLTKDVDESGLNWLRIMLRSQEQASARSKKALTQEVEERVTEFTSTTSWNAQFEPSSDPAASGDQLTGQVAGYHVMLGRLVANVLADQWKCFLAATIGIYLVMSIATRSWFAGLAALATNSLPILLVLGTMGWLGIRANMGVAMIAAVSLGLSVDSSIHYLMHYRRRLREGKPPSKALASAQENVGLAVVLATLALIAGFCSLSVSEFLPTVAFGTLTSLTMAGGLVGNLVMLPLLVAPPANKKQQ